MKIKASIELSVDEFFKSIENELGELTEEQSVQWCTAILSNQDNINRIINKVRENIYG